MTAPARTRTTAARTKSPERDKTTERDRTAQRDRTTERTGPETTTRTRSAAAERAYARREERRARSARVDTERPARKQPGEQPRPQRQRVTQQKAKQLQSKVAASRVPFVVAAMGLLGAGLVSTLWLSIAAVSGSYELQQGESDINSLSEHKEQLMREVNGMDSTPALQRRASDLGMVPASEPARLVVNPDGSVTMVGEPKPAGRPAPAVPQTPVQQTPVQQNPVPSPNLREVQAANVPAVEGR